MPVKVWLEGDQFDLQALADLFGDDDPRVAQDGDDYYLSAGELNDLSDDAKRLTTSAASILRRINGIARTFDSGFRPVTLAGRWTGDGGTTIVVGRANVEVRTRGVAVGAHSGIEQPASRPRGREYFAKLQRNASVAEVLDILGEPVPALSWLNLYDVYEIIKDEVGGDDGIVSRRWATRREVNTFRESAVRAARHRRPRGSPSGRSMTIGAGRDFIYQLAKKWLDSQ